MEALSPNRPNREEEGTTGPIRENRTTTRDARSSTTPRSISAGVRRRSPATGSPFTATAELLSRQINRTPPASGTKRIGRRLRCGSASGKGREPLDGWKSGIPRESTASCPDIRPGRGTRSPILFKSGWYRIVSPGTASACVTETLSLSARVSS